MVSVVVVDDSMGQKAHIREEEMLISYNAVPGIGSQEEKLSQ
jgi:hypothetical protein